FPFAIVMWSYRIFCCAFALCIALAIGSDESQSGIRLPQGPRDCGDVYLTGGQFEGYYAVFPDDTNPDVADLVFCTVEDGMLPNNSSVPKTNAKNCQDLKDNGMVDNGINVIYPYADHPESPVIVFCNQDILNGGWTVFQRRDNYASQLDFYKSFEEYAIGFGSPGTEFWLGNDIIHELTQQSVSELYVELTSFAGVTKYALYNVFHLGPKNETGTLRNNKRPYQLSIAYFSGTAGDSMTYHNGMGFTTYDQDHDWFSTNAAVTFHSGWWFNSDGYAANPNGIYNEGATVNVTSAHWYGFSDSLESLQRITLMTRPLKQQW
ncbi:unnamed protein product, partial [Meganyctiphanes norvegica]